MTVIGRDRTGLVESLASLIASHGGNWLESRMCRVGGEFAGILRVHVPAKKKTALVKALKGLQIQGLSVVVQPDQARPATIAGKTAVLDVIGHDRPGIIEEITRALSGQGVNVEELSTGCVSAPMSGETLFKARATLLIPQTCNLAMLRADLEKIAGELMVDVSFGELKMPG